MNANTVEYLCKALRVVEDNVEFFENAAKSCKEGPGSKVYWHLRNEALEYAHRVKTIHARFVGGEEFSVACSYGEPEEDRLSNILPMVRDWVRKHPVSKSACQIELNAVNTALDRIAASVRFFETWRDGAVDEDEKKFAELMVQEQRARYMMVSDMQYYFENPDAYKPSEA